MTWIGNKKYIENGKQMFRLDNTKLEPLVTLLPLLPSNS